MAKTRKRKSHHRKSHHRKTGHHHKGKASGGRGPRSLLRAFVPTVGEAIAAGTAGLYGFLEGKASKDKDHFLMKLPVPIASIGRCGTVAIGLWAVGALARRRFLRSMASGVVDVASYQLMRRATPFGKGGEKDTEFTLGAYGGTCDRRTPMIIDRHLQSMNDDDDDDDDARGD